MSDEATNFSDESIARDEYEMQLYGFCLKDFTRENFIFIEDHIQKEVKGLHKKLIALMKNVIPDIPAKLDGVMRKVSKSIVKSAKNDIDDINKQITASLSIPSNVVLYQDLCQLNETKPEDIKALEEECEQLIATMRQNVCFIHSLDTEIKQYEDLREIEAIENFILGNVEEHLNNNLSPELLRHTVRKVHDLKN